ncbi:hypothetical protein CVE36_00060, partial [Pseudomonas syringae pv. actinidiae]|nr:hypothetical protein [Pseudomonas syringae pv. actinidiae]
LSVDRICVAAAAHFAEHGYDAASLNEIAKAVNIKKASLYSHFASKNALFMTVFDDTLQIETAFAQQCFNDEAPDALPGSHYFSCLAKRYADSVYLRFFIYVPVIWRLRRYMTKYHWVTRSIWSNYKTPLSISCIPVTTHACCQRTM